MDVVVDNTLKPKKNMLLPVFVYDWKKGEGGSTYDQQESFVVVLPPYSVCLDIMLF